MHGILALVLGIAGFGLYLLYDVNSYTMQNRLLRGGFLAGSLLIAAATIIMLRQAWRQGAFHGVADGALIGLGLLAFGWLIYSLFFALPFQETYVSQTERRQVCDRGVYALCRHPGVICFFVVYLFLSLAALPAPFWRYGVLFSVLNLLYAWFQDRVTFPKTFCNYEEYRKRVPFIIPNQESIRNAGKTWKGFNEKEGKK